MSGYTGDLPFYIASELDVYSEYDKYENVTFNIWLMKGTHHFIQCTEHLKHKYSHLSDAEDEVNYDRLVSEFPGLCTEDQTYFPLRR